VISTRSYVKGLNKYLRTGTASIQFLDVNLYPVRASLNFPPYHYLYKTFNDRTLRLIEAGCNKKWVPKEKKLIVDKIAPEVLTMDHIGIGFKTCLIAMAIAVGVFASELITIGAQKLWKFIVDSLVARSVIETFLLSVAKN